MVRNKPAAVALMALGGWVIGLAPGRWGALGCVMMLAGSAPFAALPALGLELGSDEIMAVGIPGVLLTSSGLIAILGSLGVGRLLERRCVCGKPAGQSGYCSDRCADDAWEKAWGPVESRTRNRGPGMGCRS